MNPNDLALVKSALILMVAGMGMTFLFLVVQVICTNLNAKFSSKFTYLVPEPEQKKKPAAKAQPAADNGEIVAAIAAALHQARQC